MKREAFTSLTPAGFISRSINCRLFVRGTLSLRTGISSGERIAMIRETGDKVNESFMDRSRPFDADLFLQMSI